MAVSFPANRPASLLRSALDVSGMLGPAKAVRGLLREVPVWPALAGRGRGPRAVFLPATGRETSALLRIYNIAGALGGLGWRTAVLPATLDLAQRRRLLDRLAPDVVVMQGARHVLNRPALYPGHRIVYDMDDADFHLPHLRGPVTEAMGQVEGVIAGSRYVADWCRAQGAPARVIWTGTPVSPGRRRPHRDRPPVVAWAQSAPVDYRRERDFIEEVMAGVARARPGTRFRLYGRRPDDDDRILAPFRAMGLEVEWCPAMSYGRFLAALDDVAVGLSPVCPENAFSRGKSFGKILAYLDRGVPVVASDAADHGLFFRPDTGVITNDPAAWAAAIPALLDDPDRRQKMAGRAFDAFRTALGLEAAAQRTAAELARVVSAVPGADPLAEAA